MARKLNDTQLTLLSGAAQRPDHCLMPAEALKGAARTRAAAKLIALGYVEEIAAGRGMPVWREAHGVRIALRITVQGGAAIGVEIADGMAEVTRGSRTPRAGSKLAGIIALLSRPDGASLSEVTDATGWLPHTARAALTGLRQRGYALTREGCESRGSVYRIAQDGETAAAA